MSETLDELITAAIKEDIPTIDVTSDNIFADTMTEAVVFANEVGVVSGVKIMKSVFKMIDNTLLIKVINGDSSIVEKGDVIALLSGNKKSIVSGKQIALNFLRRMSGVATKTKIFVDQITNNHTRILDTRNTTPNFRLFEKQAVIHGGGINHRMNLSDYALLEHSHIEEAKSIGNAVGTLRNTIDHKMLIEVVVTDFTRFLEALSTTCDIIMLDNMPVNVLQECVVSNNKRKLLNASGSIHLNDIKPISETGVDFISVQEITNSYQPLDINIKF